VELQKEQQTKTEMTLAGWLQKFRLLLPQQIPGPMAVLYEKVATPGLRQFYRHVASEITSLLKSGKVLDVGTGPGHLLVDIARGNPKLELVGFDLSQKMLKMAKKLTDQEGGACADSAATHTEATDGGANAGSPLARLVKGNVQNLPFSDGEFDLVVSTLSLHHWHNPADGIRECVRVTAPGGCSWIYDLRTNAPAKAHAKLLTGRRLSRWALSCIFRFHGVDSREYEACTVDSWLGGGATVRAEVYAAYLKLSIEKPLGESRDGTIRSKNASSISSASLLT
jgi:ubiquinone/menaquinone biosynthesis C-methylase UbiE